MTLIHTKKPWLVLLFAFLLASCATDTTTPPAGAPQTGTELDRQFAEASEAFSVPLELLKAVGYAETRWQMVKSERTPGDQDPAYGIMALRGERLLRAAALAAVTPEAARTDAAANIRAGAALLSAYADDLSIIRDDLATWAPVVARYSDIALPEWQAYYVHNSVYNVIRDGVVAEEGAARATLEPYVGTLAPAFREPPAPHLKPQQQTGEPYYPPLVWNPSPDHRSRSDETVMVIIHTCEGNYAGCVSTLINGGVSAHYVVNEEGTEVSQLVDESRAAYHIAADYDSSLNGGVFPERDGTPSNDFTIGIEHAGFASGSFSDGLITTSAQLICGISKKNGIPLDAFHIVGHGQLQPEDRTDPGANWPWEGYLAKANELCGGSEPPPPPPPPPTCDLTWGVLQAGDDGPSVTALQHLLTAAGSATAADGDFGPATEAAVESFQSGNELEPDSVAGQDTWTALTSPHVLREGSRGDAVKAVQAAVGTPADGSFGPNTQNAVIAYQNANGLSVDGIVGKNTWAAISGGQGCK